MGLRRPPYAFTEHGALMAATVLNSPRAVEMNLYVVRAFVRMREVLATHDFARSVPAMIYGETSVPDHVTLAIGNAQQ